MELDPFVVDDDENPESASISENYVEVGGWRVILTALTRMLCFEDSGE
jgi:hypothetical protein